MTYLNKQSMQLKDQVSWNNQFNDVFNANGGKLWTSILDSKQHRVETHIGA